MGKSLELAERVISEGGFTYQPILDFYPESGYAVSIEGYEQAFPLTANLEKAIANFWKAHQTELNFIQHHLGGWTENGNLVLDITLVHDSIETATREAILNHQRAMFWLEKFEEIPASDYWKNLPADSLRPLTADYERILANL